MADGTKFQATHPDGSTPGCTTAAFGFLSSVWPDLATVVH
jgi:hypothetical protein